MNLQSQTNGCTTPRYTQPLPPKSGWALVAGERSGGYYRLVRAGSAAAEPTATESCSDAAARS